MKEFYYAENGTEKGPFTIDQLERKGITKDTLVWAEGMPEWKRAEEIAELFHIVFFAATPPPPVNKGKGNPPPVTKKQAPPPAEKKVQQQVKFRKGPATKQQNVPQKQVQFTKKKRAVSQSQPASFFLIFAGYVFLMVGFVLGFYFWIFFYPCVVLVAAIGLWLIFARKKTDTGKIWRFRGLSRFHGVLMILAFAGIVLAAKQFGNQLHEFFFYTLGLEPVIDGLMDLIYNS